MLRRARAGERDFANGLVDEGFEGGRLRILLVNPSRLSNPLNTGVKAAHSVPEAIAPVNLVYIAGPLVRDGRHHVEILDTVVERQTTADVCRRLDEAGFDVVGIPLYTLTLREVKELVGAIRRTCPAIHICLGGPHLDFYPEETLGWSEIDTIIQGYGERAFHQLIEALDAKLDFAEIPGLGYKDALGGLHLNKKAPMSGDYELDFELPHELLPYQRYGSVLCKSRFTGVVVTSRGCPFNCAFCTNSTSSAFAFRKIECVIRELKNMKRLGYREIMFFDETFNLGRKRIIALCQAMIDNDVKMRWSARCTIQPLTDEMLTVMKASGCSRLHLGVESGTDRVLGLMNKNTTVAESEAAVRRVHEHGIEIVGYFLFGYPGESRSEVQATIDLSKRLPIEFAQYSIFTPMAGTLDYFNSIRKGLYTDFYRDYTLDPTKEPDLHFNDEEIPREEKIAILSDAYRGFYFRPGRAIRIAKTMGNVHRVRRLAGAAKSIVFEGGFDI